MRSGRKRVTQNRETKLLGYREKEIINIKRGSRLEQKIKIILLFIFYFLSLCHRIPFLNKKLFIP